MPKIVNLGEVKDLRQEWEKVRAAISAGTVKSFYLQVVCHEGRETVFAGGAYKRNAEDVARAALRISIARMTTEDESLDFISTRH